MNVLLVRKNQQQLRMIWFFHGKNIEYYHQNSTVKQFKCVNETLEMKKKIHVKTQQARNVNRYKL